MASEKGDGVKTVAAAAAAPEEATATLTATPILTAPLPALEKKEPVMQEKCYKKTVGEEATFVDTAKDYFHQFKEIPAQKHWTCFKNYLNQKCGYLNQKCSSVFAKKVEPVVKDDETQDVMVKPAAAAVESQ